MGLFLGEKNGSLKSEDASGKSGRKGKSGPFDFPAIRNGKQGLPKEEKQRAPMLRGSSHANKTELEPKHGRVKPGCK